MTRVEQLFEQAMKLSEAEREQLADRLIQSTLPEVPGEVVSEEASEQAWMEEIKRRLDHLDRGEVQTRDWDEAMHELRAKYPRRFES